MKVALLYSNLPIPFSQLLLCSFLREFLATPAFLPFFPFLPSSSVGKPFSAPLSFSLSFYKIWVIPVKTRFCFQCVVQ